MLYYRNHSPFVHRFLCFFLPIFPLLLTSCASTTKRLDRDRLVHLTDTNVVQLLPTSAADKNIEMLQRLEADYGGKTFQMDAFLILNQDQINVTLMNSFGTTMGTLLYTSSALEFDSSLFPGNIKAAYIIFDFQLCFYSEQALRQELEGAGLELRTRQVEGRAVRDVYKGSELLVSIVQDDHSIRLENRHRGYAYTIYGDFNGM